MKVFARFIKKDGFEDRFDTLLQFGNSWDLIGNILLANPSSAKPIKNINKYDKTLAFSENIEKYFYDKPVYFGFSKVVINSKKLGNIAKNIFENILVNLKKIYEKDFNQNRFYHPMYINRSYKNPNTQSFLFDFAKFRRNTS